MLTLVIMFSISISEAKMNFTEIPLSGVFQVDSVAPKRVKPTSHTSQNDLKDISKVNNKIISSIVLNENPDSNILIPKDESQNLWAFMRNKILDIITICCISRQV